MAHGAKNAESFPNRCTGRTIGAVRLVLPWELNVKKILQLLFLSLAALWLSTCTTTSEPVTSRSKAQSEPPRGFFDRLADNLTERECRVARFSCPYGFGPAGEPCDCTDPRGVVMNGRTVK